jgi:flagellar biosynthesis anti-sigma factor FlgM
MKVEEVHRKMMALLRNEGSDKKDVPEGKSGNAQSSSPGDTVAISGTIRRMANAMSFDEVRPVRMERVTMLKSLIQSGEYNVDGRDVAAKMVAAANKRAA